jgi:hypothetical protein
MEQRTLISLNKVLTPLALGQHAGFDEGDDRSDALDLRLLEMAKQYLR